MQRVLVWIGIFAGGVASPVGAQVSSVSGPPMQADSALAALLIDSMRSSLRDLATAQEGYFADHTRYGRVLGKAGRNLVVLAPPPGVTVTLTYATSNSWAARATHTWLPGRSCVAWVGEVPPSRQPVTAGSRRNATEEGMAACDPP